MKKLLTLLGITAFALGAFAGTLQGNSTTFETGYTAEQALDVAGTQEGSQSLFWVCTNTNELEATVKSYGDQPQYAGDRNTVFSGNNSQYLAIEQTGSGAPLYRTFNTVYGNGGATDAASLANDAVTVSIGDGLYVDTLVKFSVSEESMDPGEGVKLAIWAQKGTEDSDPTNFVVHAGYFTGAAVLMTNNYTMATPADFDFDAWHRLTVKAIEDIGNGFVGFVVFVDKEPLERLDPLAIAADGVEVSLNSIASQYANSVLPSAVSSGGYKTTLSAVGFAGNGSVDDIVMTDVAPDFAADATKYVVKGTWGDGEDITAVMDSNSNYLTSGTGYDIPKGGSFALTVTFKDAGYGLKASGMNCSVTVSGDTVQVSNAEAGAEITLSAYIPAAYVNGTPYESFKDAFAAAAGSTIKLSDNVTLSDQLAASGKSDNIAVITVDFAGKTITGVDGDAAFCAGEYGKLIFTNSTDTVGGVVAGENNGSALLLAGGVAEIYGGKFDGGFGIDVEFEEGDPEPALTDYLTIYGGMFRAEDWESEYEEQELTTAGLDLCKADPEIAVYGPVDGFVTVGGAAPTPTFKVLLVSDEGATTNGLESIQAAFDDATDGDLIVFLEDVDSTITLKDDTMTYVFDPNGHQFATETPFATGDGVILGGLIQNQDGTWSQSVVNNKVSTWTNAEGDGLWATAGNWSSGLVPGQYTTVTFDGNATVGLGAEDDARSVASLVVNGNVTLRHNTQNYAYWPCVNVCGGNVSGTGTLTLERAGIKGNGGAVEINCALAFYNDTTATGSIKDSYMENGTFTVNGDVSGTGYLKVAAATTFNGNVTLGASAYAMLSVQARTVFNGAVALGDFGVVEMQTASHSFGENATLTGTGRVVCYTVGPNASLKTLLQNGGETGWTGTCELKKGNSAYKCTGDNLKPDNYGNADSTVCYNGVTGYFATGTYGQSYTICSVGCLEIGSNGFTLTYDSDTDVYSDRQYIFASALKGSGTISFGTKTGDKYTKYIFTGDVSGFTGGINFEPITSNRPVVVFKTAPEVLTAPTDYGQIIVEAGCTGARAVNAVAAWTAPGGFIVNGELNVASTGSLACDSTGQKIAGNGVISYAAKPASAPLFNDSWAGTFVANWTTSSGQAIPIDGYGVAGSTVKIAQTSTGHFSNAAANANPAFPGTLEIASGVTMTVDDSWASHANKSSVARLTGAGNLVLSHKTTGNTWGVNQPYTFTVVDGFTGTITAGHDFKLVVGTIKLASAPAAGDRVLAVTVADNGAVDISSTTITVGEEVLTPDLELKSDGLYVAETVSPTYEITGETTLDENGSINNLPSGTTTITIGAYDVTEGFTIDGTTATLLAPVVEEGETEKAVEIGETTVTLNADLVPGLYYGVGKSASVNGIARPAKLTQYTGENGTAVLTADKPEGNSGFFKVYVDVKE